MLNVHVIEGRLAATPEIKFTTTGITYTKVVLVSKRNYKKREESEYPSDSFLCVLYGKRAESFAENTCQGSLVSFTGTSQTRFYMNDQNKKVYVQELMVREYNLLETIEITSQRRANLKKQKDDSFSYAEAVEHIGNSIDPLDAEYFG